MPTNPGPPKRDLSITTTVANPSLKKGLKCSLTPVPKAGPIKGTKSRAYGRHSAFAPFFASTWLHSLRCAEVSKKRFKSLPTLIAAAALLPCALTLASGGGGLPDDAPINIKDPKIQALHDLVYDQKPPMPVPEVDYGIDPKTGVFHHPKATPLVADFPSFKGQLHDWDQQSYAKNVEVIGIYEDIASPFHSWQNIVDFGDRRYMYVYGFRNLRIFDITDPGKASLVHTKGSNWSGKGQSEEVNPFPPHERFGAASIQWNVKLGKYIMVQSYEVGRIGVMTDKMKEPEKVDLVRHWPAHKGFKVYAMNGPMPDEWELLASVSTDPRRPDAPVGDQRGSGALDVPAYFGGKYMFLSAAPDETFALTEYPDYLYSPGYQAWDMSDPSSPRFLDQFSTAGQIIGEQAHEDAYLMNPRAGNRTSWMGSRMPLFLTEPVEKGGKYGFGGMAGLGLRIVDISDPADMKEVGSLNAPPKFAGTEFDNVDVSQYERTGYVLANGYPMNDECYEPYKDIFVVDARDVTAPEIVAKLPRPTPPEEAPFSDYCQRKGSFGPKRPGYHTTQPGRWKQGVVAYAFYNAGVQLFDVSDPANATIAGYYVPRFSTLEEAPDYTAGNLTYGIYVEYDRNIIWMFTNYAIYALTSPILGEPILGMPPKPWPDRG